MSQPDMPTRELDDQIQERPAPQPPDRRAAAGAVIGALLIVALGVALFASLSTHRAPHVAAGATATLGRMPPVAPTSTAAPPCTLKPPLHGAGLPEGVKIITFAMTGPDEAWATGGVFTNPVSGGSDRGTIWRYSAGTWSQVGADLPGYYLGGLFMDSPTNGWVMGGDAYAHSVFLRISGSSWREVSPPAVDPNGLPQIIKMRAPDDGWLVMTNPKGAQGGLTTSLYHFNGASWTHVRGAPYDITDIAPVASGEAWVIGADAGGTSSLVHVRGGVASLELTSPSNSALTHLRVFAPNDIWIEGAMHASTNADINDLPLLYHYDGAAWAFVDLHAPNSAQHATIVAPDVAWSLLSKQPSSLLDQTAYGNIATISTNAGGQWSVVPLPYDDLQSLEVVSSSPSDIWALGVYTVMTQLPSSNGATSYAGASYDVLLHYNGGAWTEWGRT